MASIDIKTEKHAIDALANRRKPRPGESMTSVRQRAEKKAQMSPTDGRRARRTGRDVPVNFKVKPEFKTKLFELARKEGVPMVVILEQALAVYEKSRGGE